LNQHGRLQTARGTGHVRLLADADCIDRVIEFCD
jgi:hypothetical protein